jgi:uncharacterized membrane protein YoaT (DUF817 family)
VILPLIPSLAEVDAHLVGQRPLPWLARLPRFLREFLYFGVKEARACLFVVLFFAAVFTVPRAGLFGLPRYDVLLVVALGIQAWMLATRLETGDEVKAF